MGSGSAADAVRAGGLGRWLAREGVHLLTGGGGGAMAAVSRAFVAVRPRRGRAIGVLPSDGSRRAPRPGYPNAWIEIPIVTHLPSRGQAGETARSRNHINVLSADAVVVLAGGAGTRSEARLALRYGRPVIAYLAARADVPGLPRAVPLAASLAEVQRFVRAALAPARRRYMR
ncbi:MAG TPA: molybdenum cofactor carrier protein [Polyangia bacterium]|nr:molybdenum cofactor carrier protein [Polyangia bacterium]